MKKELQTIIKFSNLIVLIIFSILCIITTSFSMKPKDYSNLSEYDSVLVLSDDVQICNINELYIKQVGGSYYYANIFNDNDDMPILIYQGKRLNFQFNSEVIEYNEGALSKCRIVSRDSRITGTFEFELRPRKLAERERNIRLYIGYLICGIIISFLLATMKGFAIKSLQEKKMNVSLNELKKDLFFVIQKYDLNCSENEDIAQYVKDKLNILGFQTEKEFIDSMKNKRQSGKKNTIKIITAEYFISSGWLCGMTALIISIFTVNLISGFNTSWFISVPIIAAGYILKRKTVGKYKKEKGGR